MQVQLKPQFIDGEAPVVVGHGNGIAHDWVGNAKGSAQGHVFVRQCQISHRRFLQASVIGARQDMHICDGAVFGLLPTKPCVGAAYVTQPTRVRGRHGLGVVTGFKHGAVVFTKLKSSRIEQLASIHGNALAIA